MASLRREIRLEADPDRVWDAVRDFGAVHERLVPGFVTACTLDGDTRVVTFANGARAREMLVDASDARRRLVYAISNERVTHYNAVVEVLTEGAGSRLVWTIDLLPNALEPYIASQMDAAVVAMKGTLERA